MLQAKPGPHHFYQFLDLLQEHNNQHISFHDVLLPFCYSRPLGGGFIRTRAFFGSPTHAQLGVLGPACKQGRWVLGPADTRQQGILGPACTQTEGIWGLLAHKPHVNRVLLHFSPGVRHANVCFIQQRICLLLGPPARTSL